MALRLSTGGAIGFVVCDLCAAEDTRRMVHQTKKNTQRP